MGRKVISSKPSDEELERLEKTRHLLYKQGKIPRNTTSTAIRYIINEACPRICTNAWEKQEEEIQTCKQNLAKLRQENRELCKKKRYLSYWIRQLQQANGSLQLDRDRIDTKYQRLKTLYDNLLELYQNKSEIRETIETALLWDIVGKL